MRRVLSPHQLCNLSRRLSCPPFPRPPERRRKKEEGGDGEGGSGSCDLVVVGGFRAFARVGRQSKLGVPRS
ncbi:unnamed protein product [Linum trigynum]|uniref:Uncharacterized protein n=1 Tax=Linum trigynum TaxID=586398 RepID=A0AAV2ESH1_9ROSI